MLRAALFNINIDGLPKISTGYIDPGRAGGFNQGPGIEDKSFPANPWDFILAMEGATLWAGNVGRKYADGPSSIVSPFMVKNVSIGYSSAAEIDEKEARAEIWVPIWRNPVELREFQAFLSEGRAEVGNRRAGNSIEFAESIASLSTDRGIDEFVRYGILKRRGDSYVATPLGRHPATYRREVDLLVELNPILNRVDRWLNKFGQAPAQLVSLRRQIDERIIDALRTGGAEKMKLLMASLGKLEMAICKRDPSTEPSLDRSLGGLSGRWLRMADDGSLEFRLAAALSSITSDSDVGPIRANLGPIMKNKKWVTNQVTWQGNDLRTKMIHSLMRRLMDAEKEGLEHNPFNSVLRASPLDISQFVDGNTDDTILEHLLFGMGWIDWYTLKGMPELIDDIQRAMYPIGKNGPISRQWALAKMTFLPEEVHLPTGDSVVMIANNRVCPLLMAGRTKDAMEIVTRQLFLAGFKKIELTVKDGVNTSGFVSALLIPVTENYYLSSKIKNILWSD
jgi:CRISPR-associated protein Csx17